MRWRPGTMMMRLGLSTVRAILARHIMTSVYRMRGNCPVVLVRTVGPAPRHRRHCPPPSVASSVSSVLKLISLTIYGPPPSFRFRKEFTLYIHPRAQGRESIWIGAVQKQKARLLLYSDEGLSYYYYSLRLEQDVKSF